MKTGRHSVQAKRTPAGAGANADDTAQLPKVPQANPDGKPKSHVVRNVLIVVVVVILAIVLCGVSLYTSARAALNDARAIQGQVDTLKTQVLDGDKAGSEATAQMMADAAADMHDQMSNPLWSVATLVPTYGGDIQKVQALAGVADDLMANGLVPMLQEMPALDTSKIIKKDGTIVVKRVEPLVRAVGDLDPVVQRSNEVVAPMGDATLEQINGPLTTLKETLPKLAKASSACAQLAPVLPDMLGANGSRTYLLVAQNNVEMRSVGGFPGSMGPITLKNGKMRLGEFKSVYNWIPRLDTAGKGRVKISKEERKIFSKRMSYIPGDVGQIVDFERVATIWNRQWNRANTSRIDGIIAIDSVLLQSLLGITGGFTAPNGWTVDGTNAAEVLMNRSYLQMPIEQTDAFYAAVAGQAFEQVLGNIGKVNFVDLLKATNSLSDEGRLLVWMKRSQEEDAIRVLGCTGSLSDEGLQSALGVYVSDYAWSKYAWYLDRDVSVGAATQNVDGSSSYGVTVTLTNTMTNEQLAQSVPYVYGGNQKVKRDNGDMVYFLYLVPPSGGSISDVESSGYFGSYSKVNKSRTLEGKSHDREMARTSYEGRELWGGETQIEPGQSTTVSFTVTIPAEFAGVLQVKGTPAANPNLDWAPIYEGAVAP